MSSKKILVAAAVVIVLMLLFPPFHADLGANGNSNLGYNFVLYPPKFGRATGTIDALLLTVQCLGITLVTLLLWLAFRNK